jgi:hypothetical protein
MRHINLLILFYCATMASMATDREAGDPAFGRLAASHDAEIPIAIGRVVVKQSGLNAIRSTLARRGRELRLGPHWNPAAVEWLAAEKQLTSLVDDLIAAVLVGARTFPRARPLSLSRVLRSSRVASMDCVPKRRILSMPPISHRKSMAISGASAARRNSGHGAAHPSGVEDE